MWLLENHWMKCNIEESESIERLMLSVQYVRISSSDYGYWIYLLSRYVGNDFSINRKMAQN